MLNKNVESYKLLKDAYEGTGGFLDGTYLFQHPREDSNKYVTRQNMSYYLNYIKPCVDAHVKPIFKKLPNRDWNGLGSNLFELFKDNVDFQGNTISDLMAKAGHTAKLYGIAFIVMDRLPDAETEGTLSTMNERKQLPYAYVVEPLDVIEIKVDRFGNVTYFKFYECDEENDSVNATRTLTPTGWELSNSKGKTSGEWNLNKVPVIPLPSKDIDVHKPFTTSEFDSMARTNKAIYNYCSQLQEIILDQTFSVLCFPSSDMDDELEIGTNNAIGIPADATHMPQFIAPSSAPATVIEDIINRLQNEIYRMSGVVTVQGTEVKAQSGIAKAYDFQQTNQLLADFSTRVQRAEMKLISLFQEWMGIDINYTTSYPKDFSIADLETELSNAQICKDFAFGDRFDVEIFKKVLTAYLPEIKDKAFDDMVDAYVKTIQYEVDEQ